MIDGLTNKQQEILDQIHIMLSEHFDAHVIIVDCANVNDTGDHLTAGQYNGGPATAMGLCQYQFEHIKHSLFFRDDDE